MPKHHLGSDLPPFNFPPSTHSAPVMHGAYAQPTAPPANYGQHMQASSTLSLAGTPMPVQQIPFFQQPYGIEYLKSLDQILIHQKMEMFEIATGVETANQYVIKNSMGQQIFSASEISDPLARHFGGSSRLLSIQIRNNFNQNVIYYDRPYKIFVTQKLSVLTPGGHVIGYVKEKCTMFAPKFKLLDARDVILRVTGPLITSSFGGDVNFDIWSANGHNKIGGIRKQWSGWMREAFPDADNFSITFPKDLHVNLKAVKLELVSSLITCSTRSHRRIIGAFFLVDYMFYEESQTRAV